MDKVQRSCLNGTLYIKGSTLLRNPCFCFKVLGSKLEALVFILLVLYSLGFWNRSNLFVNVVV